MVVSIVFVDDLRTDAMKVELIGPCRGPSSVSEVWIEFDRKNGCFQLTGPEDCTLETEHDYSSETAGLRQHIFYLSLFVGYPGNLEGLSSPQPPALPRERAVDRSHAAKQYTFSFDMLGQVSVRTTPFGEVSGKGLPGFRPEIFCSKIRASASTMAILMSSLRVCLKLEEVEDRGVPSTVMGWGHFNLAEVLPEGVAGREEAVRDLVTGTPKLMSGDFRLLLNPPTGETGLPVAECPFVNTRISLGTCEDFGTVQPGKALNLRSLLSRPQKLFDDHDDDGPPPAAAAKTSGGAPWERCWSDEISVQDAADRPRPSRFYQNRRKISPNSGSSPATGANAAVPSSPSLSSFCMTCCGLTDDL